MLQTRNGKRTAEAALKIAVDMAAEQLITREQAIARIDPARWISFAPDIIPRQSGSVWHEVASLSLAASANCVSADQAEARAASGEQVILVRVETSRKIFTVCTLLPVS